MAFSDAERQKIVARKLTLEKSQCPPPKKKRVQRADAHAMQGVTLSMYFRGEPGVLHRSRSRFPIALIFLRGEPGDAQLEVAALTVRGAGSRLKPCKGWPRSQGRR